MESDAYEQFLQNTVGPAVKLRDYIIDLKQTVAKQSADIEFLLAKNADLTMECAMAESDLERAAAEDKRLRAALNAVYMCFCPDCDSRRLAAEALGKDQSN